MIFRRYSSIVLSKKFHENRIQFLLWTSYTILFSNYNLQIEFIYFNQRLNTMFYSNLMLSFYNKILSIQILKGNYILITINLIMYLFHLIVSNNTIHWYLSDIFLFANVLTYNEIIIWNWLLFNRYYIYSMEKYGKRNKKGD